MMVGEDEQPPPPGSLQGVYFFGKNPEEAKAAALSFCGRVESVNGCTTDAAPNGVREVG